MESWCGGGRVFPGEGREGHGGRSKQDIHGEGPGEGVAEEALVSYVTGEGRSRGRGGGGYGGRTEGGGGGALALLFCCLVLRSCMAPQINLGCLET